MADLYDRVLSITTELPKLHSQVNSLQETWTKGNLDPFELVDHLYTTAEYVDNEFYKKLWEVRAKPSQVSVLHLRYYDKELPKKFERIWENIAKAVNLYPRRPVYDFAQEIVKDVLPEFNSAFGENPDRAYRELRGLVEQFVGEMQNSRFLLKTPTG
jgi:hypothetical protein